MSRILIGDEVFAAAPGLSRFYLQREDRPAWCGPRGPYRQADALLRVLRRIEEDGLNPEDYHLTVLERRMAEWRGTGPVLRGLSAGRLTELDLLLTDAFLRCGSHLQQGRVRPRQIHPEWQARSRPADLAGLLQISLDLGQVEKALLGLRPPQVGYERLRRALREYREIEAGGRYESVTGRLRRGSRGEEVQRLCRGLVATGDLEPGGEKKRFDGDVEKGLKHFQERHGLAASGRVDSATQGALAVPLKERIAQIELNMERWRWLPHDQGTRYVLVRIADFGLEVVENGESVLDMRVIVGRPFWRTPIFSSMMTHLEFNPSWYIPRSIAVEEILPAVRRDSTYLSLRHIQVVVGSADTARTVSADSIDWETVDEEDFDYLLTQPSGPANPLGKVKFFFPNPFDVYLHDTPSSELFGRRERDLSHGCIRLEKGLELAGYALGESWSRERVDAVVQTGEHRMVGLPRPIPVFLLYWTAWVDEQGNLQFREDWYDADQRLQGALAEAMRR